MVNAGVPALFVERSGYRIRGNRAQGLGQSQFPECGGVGGQFGHFAGSFQGEKGERLVFFDGRPEGAAVLLTAEGRLGLVALLREKIIRVQRLVAFGKEQRAVQHVGARLRDQVDRGTGSAAIGGGEALGGNGEFFHRFQRHLHHRTANRVVLIVNAVDSDVDIASAGAIGGKDGDAVLGGVVGVDRLYAGREESQIREVPAVEGQALHIGGRDGHRDFGLGGIDLRRFGGDGDGFGLGSGLERDIELRGHADLQVHLTELGYSEAGGFDGHLVGIRREQIQIVLAGTAGIGHAFEAGGGIQQSDFGVGHHGMRTVIHHSLEGAGGVDLGGKRSRQQKQGRRKRRNSVLHRVGYTPLTRMRFMLQHLCTFAPSE